MSGLRSMPRQRQMSRQGFAGLALVSMLALLLTACSGTVPTPRSKPQPAPGKDTRPPVQYEVVPRPRPEPQVMHIPGLEGVIGANAAALLRQFGKPRLDLFEGDVHKLQFSGKACVLDIYLYPPRGGGDPVATHVDARRGSDGQDVDRASCVEALRKR